MVTDPSSSDEGLVGVLSKTLSRTTSQPSLLLPKLLEKRLKQLTGGVGVFVNGDSQQKHEDDLDIIKQIIETDESMHMVREPGDEEAASGDGDGSDSSVGCLRSQSLTHIPSQFSCSSLPSLHHAESMHILHANYNSAPDFSQFGKKGLVGGPHNHSNLMPLPIEYDESAPLGQNLQGGMCRDFPPGDASRYGNGNGCGYHGQDDPKLRMHGSWRFNGQRLESVYEGQSMPGTSPSMFGSGNDPQGRPSFDFGHQQQQHFLQEQQHHGYGGVSGGGGGSVGHALAMARSASVSAGCYSPSSSSLRKGHALSTSNPNISPEVSSIVNHYPSAENLSSSPANPYPPALSPPLPHVSTTGDGLLGGASGGQRIGASASASVDYNMLGNYLTGGEGPEGGGHSNQGMAVDMSLGRGLLNEGIDSKKGILGFGLEMLPNNLKSKEEEAVFVRFVTMLHVILLECCWHCGRTYQRLRTVVLQSCVATATYTHDAHTRCMHTHHTHTTHTHDVHTAYTHDACTRRKHCIHTRRTHTTYSHDVHTDIIIVVMQMQCNLLT